MIFPLLYSFIFSYNALLLKLSIHILDFFRLLACYLLLLSM